MSYARKNTGVYFKHNQMLCLNKIYYDLEVYTQNICGIRLSIIIIAQKSINIRSYPTIIKHPHGLNKTENTTKEYGYKRY